MTNRETTTFGPLTMRVKVEVEAGRVTVSGANAGSWQDRQHRAVKRLRFRQDAAVGATTLSGGLPFPGLRRHYVQVTGRDGAILGSALSYSRAAAEGAADYLDGLLTPF